MAPFLGRTTGEPGCGGLWGSPCGKHMGQGAWKQADSGVPPGGPPHPGHTLGVLAPGRSFICPPRTGRGQASGRPHSP